MTKKTLTLIFILILAFLALNFSYSKYLNQGISYINNSQFSVLNYKIKLPSFPETPFKLGLDLQGGIRLLYDVDLSSIGKEDYTSSVEGLRDVIERRVNFFGVQEPTVQVQKKGENFRLVVELAGIKDPVQAIEEIGKTPFLEFKEQMSEQDLEEIQKKREEIEGKNPEEIKQVENWQLAFIDGFQATQLTGKYLEKAELDFDQTTFKPVILLQFNDEGSKIFNDLTSKNIKKPLAIYIDGILISSPIVQEAISGGSAQITGNFTIKEAKKLVRNLNAGALPLPIELISQQLIGPTLGKISLEKSLQAGAWGLLLVAIFMVLIYRLPGILATVALTIYVALVLSLFKLIPVTLTLAGIGGFILSIGMAIDANILIFSRLREELKEEKSLPDAIEEGFRRAWPAIRDGNFTTLIIALILFSLGTGFVKGFALTLALGIIISIFSAIFITKNFLEIFGRTKLKKWKWLWK